jgi:type I restriction enzyme S subunit
MTKLPRGWKEDVFGSISRIANGQVDPKKFPYKEMIHIGPENIESDSGILSNLRTAEELGLISGKYEFDEHAIVYSKIRPNLNKLAIPGFRGICSADMYPIWPAEGVDREYLFWIMRSQHFYSQAVACSTRTGLPKINRDGLSAISVLIPPLTEQKQIAALLKSWDKPLNTLQKIIDVKREHKRALMQRLLTGKVRFPEFAGEPLHLKQLGQFIEEVTDRNKNQSITRVLSVTNHSGFVLPEEQFSRRVASEDVSNYKIVRKGQFAYNPSRINVGSLARLQQYDEGILSPMYVIFKHDAAKLDSEFLWQWLGSDEARKRIIASTQGSVRDSVGYSTLASFNLKIPSLPEQRKIAAVLSAADREINLLTQKLDAYKQQKKGLMQQLLTGKKRVNLENKEAA